MLTQTNFFQQAVIKSLQLFLPLAILCIFAAVSIYLSNVKTIHNQIHSDERHKVDMAVHSVKRVVQSITTDLSYLATQHELIEIISRHDKPENNHQKELKLHNWLSFSQIKKTYDQIRWLDESGQERERVNFNNNEPYFVSKEKLQNKARRYYFADSYKLNRGEFFISPMDLNIENGKIEQPLKPMIRVGTPVFSIDGDKKGIILLNYFAENLLNEFFNKKKSSSTPWLINREGYWLKGPSKDLEWGFMYQNSLASMAYLYPQAWSTIMASNKGQFVNDAGLWSYSTIYPLIEGQKTSTGTFKAFSPRRSELERKNYIWKAVLLMPHDRYQSVIKPDLLFTTLICLIILVFLYTGCWLIARAWIRERETDQKLVEVNKNLENTINKRTRQLLRAKKNVEDLAETDELTGMNNRRAFFNKGHIINEQAIRYRLQFTVMMIDIDWLKKVNDIHGHSIGDIALKNIARIILKGIRIPDISGRIGGEEFAIILPQTSAQKTVEIAERLRKTVKSIVIPIDDNNQLTLTVSIGIGQYSDENQSLHEVLNMADKALYQAKDQGKNRVVLFSE